MVELRSLTALARVKVPRSTGLLSFRRGQDVADTLGPFVIGLFIPPATVPGGVLMSDDGTGTNGDPWPASNWEAGLNTGSATFDIQSNQLRVTASATTFATNRVLETLITGQGGAFDITLDYTVSNVAVAHGALITVNGGAGDSDRFEFAHYFHTGTVDLAKVAGFSYSYPGSGSVAVAVADVVHVHMVRDPASGQFDVTMWLNAASEPGTPTISITDTDFPVDRIEFGIYDPSSARTVIYDNIVVSALGGAGGTDFPISLSGSSTAAAALVRGTAHKVVGALSAAAVLVRAGSKPIAGTASPAGAAAKSASKPLSGSTAPASFLEVLRVFLRNLTGSLTASASTSRTAGKRAAGAAASSASLTRSASTAAGGSVSPAGQIGKGTERTVAGAIVVAGGVLRSVGKIIRGTIAAIAELVATRSSGPAADPGTVVLAMAVPDVELSAGPLAEISLAIASPSVAITGRAAAVNLSALGPSLSLVPVSEE